MFFPPCQPFERGRKERKKERKEDGWDGMGWDGMGWDVCSIVFPFFFFEPGIVGWIRSSVLQHLRDMEIRLFYVDQEWDDD
jgi:hypothetical protein